MIGKTLKHLFFIFCLCTSCLAQEIEVRLEPKQINLDESFVLSITLKNFQSDKTSAPRLSQSKEFIITSSGTANKSSYINGVVSSEFSHTYTLTPREGLPPRDYLTLKG